MSEELARAPGAPLELWGGIECTVNRVGDRYLDQIARTGHDRRPDDLERIAALGIKTLRYPVLWERVVPDHPDVPDWRWADGRLEQLRDLGIRPIVGLCHHGSGPRWTGLLDPHFPRHLARYARAVAERYPWVDAFTPVNEPLTTARFAALYGHWHPHVADSRQMIRALINECRATQLAMREVRVVNPGAHHVQTEELGRIWSTPELRYQADFENQRRWLSLDLLCGGVREGHPLWHYLSWLGLEPAELLTCAEDPAPPDIIGINYYLTSERFLDHRWQRYPPETRGGNGRQAYADVEAVRVRADGFNGPGAALGEAWERYGRPVAITEAHLASTPGQQIRWIAEVWRDAGAVRARGADVRAVTAWSLLGAWDWHCLVAREEGHYEPGAFDVRFPSPHATPLAHFLASLATGTVRPERQPEEPGWWESPERLLFPPVDAEGNDIDDAVPRSPRYMA